LAQRVDQDITVTVGEVPADTKVAKVPEKKEDKKEATPNRLGLVVSEISADDRKTMKIDNGVQVSESDGAAGRAGIREGDVILSLNNIDVKSPSQFNDLVIKLDAKKPVALLVKRENQTRYVTLRIADSK
jgi:serine protease Do